MVTLDLYLHATPLFSPYIMNSLHNGFIALVLNMQYVIRSLLHSSRTYLIS